MKKIVGIIAALALAGAVFADAPTINVTDITFDGKASLEWIADLDAETTGMKNAASGNFKLKFVKKGDKVSSGDGVWGEIKIEAGDKEAANGGNVAVPTVDVKTATIHFLDDGFYLDMSILKPGLGIGGGDIITATDGPKAFPSASVTITGAQGFKLTFGLKDTIDFGLVFVDNGEQKAKAKKFGFVFDVATGKDLVEGLGFKASAGYGTEKEKFVAAAKVDYKLAIGDMYLKPAVGFALDEAEAKNLSAGVLFGWGGDGVKAEFTSFSNGVKNVPDKCADGVSVYATVPLKDSPAIGFLFSAFDSKFLGDFGLKIGAQLAVADLANFGKGSDAFDAAIKFGKAFGDWNVDANAGIKFIIDGSKFGALYGAGISNSALIDNTKLYLKYAGEHGADVGGKDLKGKITLGCEMSI